jgi:DNA polymerase V
LFQPKLEGRPVVVLSNNDGCVISRSQEVKDLGVKIAVPWYQLKDIANRYVWASLPVRRWLNWPTIIPVGEVWGVGRRSTTRLQALGIDTVLDLKRAAPKRIRDEFSVVQERTIAELNGVACLELDELMPDKQQIICSRSFGSLVSNLADLEQAVISYATRAAEKLRAQHSIAAGIQVYIRTNPHKEHDPQHQEAMLLPLTEATDDTRQLCHAALHGLRRIYRNGYAYQKAGVMLTEITPRNARVRDLFDDVAAQQKSHALMTTLDKINRRMGSGSLRLLGEGTHKSWAMRRDNVSPRYTTEWRELAVASA